MKKLNIIFNAAILLGLTATITPATANVVPLFASGSPATATPVEKQNIEALNKELFSIASKFHSGNEKEEALKKVQYLISKGANINTANKYGTTPLIKAIKESNYEIAKALLANGAHINTVDEDSNTPLIQATRGFNSEIALDLISKGADINAVNEYGTPLIFASSWWGHLKTVDVLIKKGADVNAVSSKYGTTALMRVAGKSYMGRGSGKGAEQGLKQIMSMLIEHGADLDAQSKEGKTALMKAARMGNTERALILIAAGADIQIKDNKDKYGQSTAIDIARENNHPETAAAILTMEAVMKMMKKQPSIAPAPDQTSINLIRPVPKPFG